MLQKNKQNTSNPAQKTFTPNRKDSTNALKDIHGFAF